MSTRVKGDLVSQLRRNPVVQLSYCVVSQVVLIFCLNRKNPRKNSQADRMAGLNPNNPANVPNPTNPFQPSRRTFVSPNWRNPRTDWEVNSTPHLDYSVNDRLPIGNYSFDAYHTGEVPTNLAERIKCQWYNTVYNDPGFSGGKLT